jgi:hypothetical protein
LRLFLFSVICDFGEQVVLLLLSIFVCHCEEKINASHFTLLSRASKFGSNFWLQRVVMSKRRLWSMA